MDFDNYQIYVVHSNPVPTGFEKDFIAFLDTTHVVAGYNEAEAIGKLVLSGCLPIVVNRVFHPHKPK